MSTLSVKKQAPTAENLPDDAFIKRALELADPNVLRMALHQLTQDPKLAAMKTDVTPIWAGALFTYTLAPEHHAEIRQIALDYIKAHPEQPVGNTETNPKVIRETMELFGHGKLNENDFRLGYEEGGFDEFPRAVKWNKRPPQEVIDKTHIVVVGAGVCGIASAVHLQKLGLNFTVLERMDDLGGTWHLNNYPHARVDSTSIIYQFKFEKRYPWKEYFATGGATKEYLKHVCTKFGVADKIQYNKQVIAGEWDDAAKEWVLTVQNKDGSTQIMRANFVVSAAGQFSTPKMPDIPGIDTFKGTLCHTTGWKAEYDVKGKRVAQIGNGASGVQLMPYLAQHASSVTVFQRTPAWVMPMEFYRDQISDEQQWLFQRFPLYWHWHSYGMFFLNGQYEKLQDLDPEWRAKGGVVSKRNDELRENAIAHMKKVLADRPDLLEKLIPKHPPIAHRPTVDSGWYESLLRDNVELVTTGIDHIDENGIVAKDGKRYDCDFLVCAVGFNVLRYLWPTEYVGRNGATFEQLWKKDGPRAYWGVTAPGFPNFFMFYGPGSQARGGSFYAQADSLGHYASEMIVHVMESGASSIECTMEAFEEFNRQADEKNKSLIWETYGQNYYYVTPEGRSVVHMPFPCPEYFAHLREPKYEHYKID